MFHPLRRSARGALLAGLTAAATLLPTAMAAAGTYSVYANRLPDNTAVPAGPWTSGYNVGTTAGGDLGVRVPGGVGSGWATSASLSPPAGTTFSSATIEASRVQYNGWDYGQSVFQTTWGNFGWYYNLPSGFGGYIETGTQSGTWTATNPSSLSMRADCVQGGTCTASNGHTITKARYVINDPTNPTASLTASGGELLDGSWHTTASALLDVTASDGESGAYRAFFRTAGQTFYAALDGSNARCRDVIPAGNSDPYQFSPSATSLVPCKTASQSYQASFDLTQLGDGSHTGVIGVEDAAGNETVIGGTRTVRVNAPGGSLGDPGTTGPGGCIYQADGSCSLPPTSTLAPSIPGTPKRATALAADPGQWDNVTGATFGYQWQRCNTTDPSTCSNISGATSLSYTPVLADVDKRLRIVVTATTPSSGSGTSASTMTPLVQDSAPAGGTPSGGGGAAPLGGGGGGGGTPKKDEENDKPRDPAPAPEPRDHAPPAPAPGANRGPVNGTNGADDATLKVVFDRTKSTVMRSRYGKPVTITGRLTTRSGTPIGSAQLGVVADLGSGETFSTGRTRTKADGTFTVRLPGTAVGDVRVSYRSHLSDDAPAEVETLTLRVAPSASLTVRAKGKGASSRSRRSRVIASNGSTLLFVAKVAGPIPVGGKTVQLQSRCTVKGCAKGWANFGPSGQRTNSKGEFLYRLKTTGTIGKVTYRFRLVVPQVDGASNDWPFVTGYSPVRALTIHGSPAQ